jgi:ABC-type polysaccharide transport system permease subunit
MGPNLTSKPWIIAKGLLFALLAAIAGTEVIFAETDRWQRGLLLAVCVWAACRFYYFLFHVLHAYVDPALPSAGVVDLLRHLLARRRRKRDAARPAATRPRKF